MIEKLRVQNFRCLRDVEVPLGPLNFLIGPNNTGKSSFLDAVELLSRCVDAERVETAFRTSRFRLDRLLTGGDQDLRLLYDVSLSLAREEGLADRAACSLGLAQTDGVTEIAEEFVEVVSGKEQVPLTWRNERWPEPVSCSLGPVEYNSQVSILHQLVRGRVPACADLIRLLRCAPKYGLVPSRVAQPCEVLPSFKLDPDGFGLAACLDLLREREPARFEEIMNALRLFVDSVDMVTFPTVEPGKKAILFHERPKGCRVYASEASDGLLLFLAYLTIAYARRDVSVLLIEEPETGVHPRRLRATVEVLRAISRGALGAPPVQVVATSHSPYLLDWCSKDEIIVFQRDAEGDAHATPLSQVRDIEERLKDFTPGELIYTFGEQICESRS